MVGLPRQAAAQGAGKEEPTTPEAGERVSSKPELLIYMLDNTSRLI
jgi:hypothetical protein